MRGNFKKCIRRGLCALFVTTLTGAQLWAAEYTEPPEPNDTLPFKTLKGDAVFHIGDIISGAVETSDHDGMQFRTRVPETGKAAWIRFNFYITTPLKGQAFLTLFDNSAEPFVLSGNESGETVPNSVTFLYFTQGLGEELRWNLEISATQSKQTFTYDITYTAKAIEPISLGTLVGGDSSDIFPHETGVGELFLFELKQSASLTFDTFGTDLLHEGADSHIGLFDSEGRVLAANDDADESFLSSVSRTLGPGEYYLAVAEYRSIFGFDETEQVELGWDRRGFSPGFYGHFTNFQLNWQIVERLFTGRLL